MHYRSIVIVLIAIACSMPVSVRAYSLADLQQQASALIDQLLLAEQQIRSINTTTPTPVVETPSAVSGGVCPNLVRNLSRGSRGGDVTELQLFLVDKGFLAADSVTGFFGAMTQASLQRWQADAGVVSSGSPQTTGWGSVGARTRKEILTRCRQYIPPVQCPAIPAASLRSCAPGQTLERAADCSQICTGTGITTLRITGSSGPAALSTGQQGTWGVIATDSSSSTLSYAVTWGDETSVVTNGVYTNATLVPIFGSSASFSHAYTNAGSYTVTVTVRNAMGLTAKTSMPVQIISGAPSTAPAISLPYPAAGTNVLAGTGPTSPGGTVAVGWNVLNAPTDAVLQLWLVDVNGRDYGIMQTITSSGSAASGVTGNILNGSYSWRVPGPSCDAQRRCQVRADGCGPYGLYAGTYYIVAKLYRPTTGGSPSYSNSCFVASSYLTTTQSALFTIASSTTY